MQLVLGYLVNEIWLRDYAKQHQYYGDLDPETLALYHESTYPILIRSEEMDGMYEAGCDLIVRCGMRATLKPVWISNSTSCFCWCIARSFHPNMWTPEEAVLLERFKDLIGAKGEPSFWGSTDGDVPKSMQDQVKLRKEHWEMALNSLPSEDMLSASTDLCEFSDGGCQCVDLMSMHWLGAKDSTDKIGDRANEPDGCFFPDEDFLNESTDSDSKHDESSSGEPNGSGDGISTA